MVTGGHVTSGEPLDSPKSCTDDVLISTGKQALASLENDDPT